MHYESKKVVRNPYDSLSEDEMLTMLEIARTHANQGMVKDADDVVADLRSKYDL